MRGLSSKLGALAEKAKQFQLESGTTSPSLDHLAENYRTTRQTISLVLTDDNTSDPTFVFHREAMVRKPAAPGAPVPPTVYRAAVFGGGVEAEEEKRLKRIARTDPLLVDRSLLDENGLVPPDAWYRMQGKHLLEYGRLLQMHYNVTPQIVQSFIQTEVRKRLKMEAGAASAKIDQPIVLRSEPVETAVLNRRLGEYTEAIAARHGLTINNNNELVGIGILVQERFAMAQLLCDPREFADQCSGNAIVWSADQLVAIAERDTNDLDAWKSRLEHQGENELPIRNHSLLVGASSAAAALEKRNWILTKLGRWWRRASGKKLSIAA